MRPVSTVSIHHELEKEKFSKFFGSLNGAVAKAWLENMEM
jgi:hypothetical protein